MPLFIAHSTEPLANPDRDKVQEGPWLESDAQSALQRDIQRYMQAEIRGRSLLVAGHRGAGKTTAVHTAIEKLTHTAETPGSRTQCTDHQRSPRPLLVKIHGPDLLKVTDCPVDDFVAVPKEGCDPSPGGDPQCSDEHFARHARRQIVLSLLRALCDEAADCYERKALDDSSSPDKTNEERHEQAAQFRLELDLEPEELRLREYWEHVSGLPHGIFCHGGGLDKTKTAVSGVASFQGYREIVALATALRVHREIHRHQEAESRKVRNAPSDSKLHEESSEPGVVAHMTTFLTKSSHLLNPIAGIAVGIALVVIMIKSDVELLLALIIGMFGAVAATFLLNFAAAKDQTFNLVANPNSASLNLMLPVMLKRVRAAHLHPIFVVDELDKVPKDLPDLMARLMNSLKHIVADQAFFCFLVSREYFEMTAKSRREQAYPPAETYFGDLIFVHHNPAQIHTYLEKLMMVPGEDKCVPEDYVTKSLFIYIALYESKMHVGRLQRYITANSKADGQVDIKEPGLKEVLAYRYETLLQVAVELVLGDSELQAQLRKTPEKTVQIYDALYYPARQWDDGQIILQTAPQAFGAYLKHRAESGEIEYTDADIRLLREKMLQVVKCLEQPEILHKHLSGAIMQTELFNALWKSLPEMSVPASLASRGGLKALLLLALGITESQSPQKRLRDLASIFLSDKASESILALCDAVEAFEVFEDWTPLLKPDPSDEDLFLWRFDRYGRELEEVVFQAQKAEVLKTTEQFILTIQALDEMIRSATYGAYGFPDLDTRFHLLPPMPPWPELKIAVDDYLSISEKGGTSKEARLAIEEYKKRLLGHSELLRLGLLLAWSLGVKNSSPAKRYEGSALRSGLDSEIFKDLNLAGELTAAKKHEIVRHALVPLESVTYSSLTPLSRLAEKTVLHERSEAIDGWLPAMRALLVEGGDF